MSFFNIGAARDRGRWLDHIRAGTALPHKVESIEICRHPGRFPEPLIAEIKDLLNFGLPGMRILADRNRIDLRKGLQDV